MVRTVPPAGWPFTVGELNHVKTAPNSGVFLSAEEYKAFLKGEGLSPVANDGTAEPAPMTEVKSVQTLCAGRLMPLYDKQELLNHARTTNPGDAMKALYAKMLNTSFPSMLYKPVRMPDLADLRDKFPNFGGVIDYIERNLSMCVGSDDDMYIPPFLLVGPPGVGKTLFAKQLARLLEIHFKYVPMASTTAGWVLSGASAQWREAKHGKIFDALTETPCANPLVMLDEIEKSGVGGAYGGPLAPLYELLERDTAREFRDEFVDFPVDASNINWVCTANDLRPLPEPLVSRMRVFDIKAPDKLGKMSIAQTLYDNLLSNYSWGDTFEAVLSDDVLDRLSDMSPREMKLAITDAIGDAKLANRTHIEVTAVKKNREATKIGFIS